jgi:hypothetical protein
MGGRPEAVVSTRFDTRYADLGTLAAVVACSPIIVARPSRCRRLPAGFDEADLAILEWIAAEGRRVGGSFLRM